MRRRRWKSCRRRGYEQKVCLSPPLKRFSKIGNGCPNESAEHCTRLRTLDCTPPVGKQQKPHKGATLKTETRYKNHNPWIFKHLGGGRYEQVSLWPPSSYLLNHSLQDFMRLIGLSI